MVPNAGETARAQRLLATYGGDVNAFLEVYRHVELSEGRPFAERAEEIAEHYRANLIVMGTEALAAGGTGLGSNALALAKRVRVPLMILKPEAGRRIMIGASSKKVVAQVQTKEEPQEELEVTLAARPNGGQPEKPVGVRTLLAYETGAVGTSMVRFVSMLLRPDMDSLILARATGLAPGAAPPLTGAPAQLAIQSNMQTSAEVRGSEQTDTPLPLSLTVPAASAISHSSPVRLAASRFPLASAPNSHHRAAWPRCVGDQVLRAQCGAPRCSRQGGAIDGFGGFEGPLRHLVAHGAPLLVALPASKLMAPFLTLWEHHLPDVPPGVGETVPSSIFPSLVQVPPGKQLPQEVSDALLVSRCAVLLYRMEPGVPWAEERQ